MDFNNIAIISTKQWCNIKPTTTRMMTKALMWDAKKMMLLVTLIKHKISKLNQWKILIWFTLWERKVSLSFQKKRIKITTEETQKQIIKAVSFQKINNINSNFHIFKICPCPFKKHFHQPHARNANVFWS